ncbi:MAG: EAL domain-containing protein [Gammaproteobacteria bacterium]|nr:EAL domain-containing protein [Gammaproteobacteria bacterium]
MKKLTEEERERIEKALWGLVKVKNKNIFHYITKSVAHYLGADFAFISILPDAGLVETISFIEDGKLGETYYYELSDTPCAKVVKMNDIVSYEKAVQAKFPKDLDLKEMKVQSYIGASLVDKQNRVIGLMSVMGHTALKKTEYVEKIFEVYRSRASLELERLINEEKIKKTEKHFEKLTDELPLGIFLVDEKAAVQYCNKTAIKLFGYTESELLNKDIKQLLPSKLRSKHPALVKKYMKMPSVRRFGENRNIQGQTKEGNILQLDITLFPLSTTDGELVVCSVLDVSAQKKAEQDLISAAYQEPLTKLSNRTAFVGALLGAIGRSERAGKRFALLYIDVDHFKQINDLYGHIEGDKLLFEMSTRLKKVYRKNDFIARTGGDEFVLITESLSSMEQAGRLAKRVLEALSQPILLGENEREMSVSIGIAIYPDSGETSDELLMHADKAMHQAKKDGRRTFRYFTHSLHDKYIRNEKIGQCLRSAISENELYPVYQPVICAVTEKVLGVEVLLRWKSKTLGVVGPSEFIPIAEKAHLILELGNYVLDKACQQMEQWNRLFGHKELMFSVNFSTLQFSSKQYDKHILSVIKKYHLSEKQLIIELTESALIKDFDSIIIPLKKLQKKGVHIAIDDFGTGYASLTYLKKLPLNFLKIDQSFIADIKTSLDAEAIVKSVLYLGKTIGVQVIAEGVEAKEQVDFLNHYDCPIFQGYYFSKPVKGKEIETLLKKERFKK